MRNLAQYPITKQEIIAVLLSASNDAIDEGACGDIRPLCLSIAARFIAYSDEKEIDGVSLDLGGRFEADRA